MIFNFFLNNHEPPGLRGMSDLVVPIYHGLMDGGHHVIGFGLGLQTAPIVNVLFEFFPDDGFVDNLLNIKAQAGDRFIFGLICTEDLEDKLVMEDPLWPRRRANLLRVLPKADFVWTLLPQVEAYEAIAGAGKVELLEYGFTERGFNPYAPTDPALRDIDVMMYGNETPYRMPVIQALSGQGFTCFVSQRDTFPDFATTDLVSRAKIVLDIRRGPGVRYPSPTRISKALHNGALVVAEDLGPSAISSLYQYGVACPYDALAARCEQLIRSGAYVEQGRAALQRFRAETSMRDSLARAMALPCFQRVAGR